MSRFSAVFFPLTRGVDFVKTVQTCNCIRTVLDLGSRTVAVGFSSRDAGAPGASVWWPWRLA